MKIFQRSSSTIAESIVWWEAGRIPLNMYFILIILLSFTIGYVNIPIFYFLVILCLNLLYTCSWLIEIVIIRPFESNRLITIYTKVFLIIFYSYFTLGIFFYTQFPQMLDWVIQFWYT
jgi:hypothetical protein